MAGARKSSGGGRKSSASSPKANKPKASEPTTPKPKSNQKRKASDPADESEPATKRKQSSKSPPQDPDTPTSPKTKPAPKRKASEPADDAEPAMKRKRSSKSLSQNPEPPTSSNTGAGEKRKASDPSNEDEPAAKRAHTSGASSAVQQHSTKPKGVGSKSDRDFEARLEAYNAEMVAKEKAAAEEAASEQDLSNLKGTGSKSGREYEAWVRAFDAEVEAKEKAAKEGKAGAKASGGKGRGSKGRGGKGMPSKRLRGADGTVRDYSVDDQYLKMQAVAVHDEKAQGLLQEFTDRLDVDDIVEELHELPAEARQKVFAEFFVVWSRAYGKWTSPFMTKDEDEEEDDDDEDSDGDDEGEDREDDESDGEDGESDGNDGDDSGDDDDGNVEKSPAKGKTPDETKSQAKGKSPAEGSPPAKKKMTLGQTFSHLKEGGEADEADDEDRSDPKRPNRSSQSTADKPLLYRPQKYVKIVGGNPRFFARDPGCDLCKAGYKKPKQRDNHCHAFHDDVDPNAAEKEKKSGKFLYTCPHKDCGQRKNRAENGYQRAGQYDNHIKKYHKGVGPSAADRKKQIEAEQGEGDEALAGQYPSGGESSATPALPGPQDADENEGGEESEEISEEE